MTAFLLILTNLKTEWTKWHLLHCKHFILSPLNTPNPRPLPAPYTSLFSLQVLHKQPRGTCDSPVNSWLLTWNNNTETIGMTRNLLIWSILNNLAWRQTFPNPLITNESHSGSTRDLIVTQNLGYQVHCHRLITYLNIRHLVDSFVRRTPSYF